MLLALGAYSQAAGLLKPQLGLTVYGRTVVLAEVGGELLAQLREMPSLGDMESDAYILPPIAYPDGRHYVKIGRGKSSDPQLETAEDLAEWFKSAGDEQDRRDLKDRLLALIPDLASSPRWLSDSCAVTQTASGLPILDFVAGDKVAILTGGNGKGAKSSDDWGWLAARMVAGAPWEHPVDRQALQLSWQDC